MASNDTPTRPPESTEELDDAHKEIERLENADELPTELSDWPGGKAKFLTLGGDDAGDRYGEGATSELGPGDLVRHEGGAVSIAGKMVDRFAATEVTAITATPSPTWRLRAEAKNEPAAATTMTAAQGLRRTRGPVSSLPTAP